MLREFFFRGTTLLLAGGLILGGTFDKSRWKAVAVARSDPHHGHSTRHSPQHPSRNRTTLACWRGRHASFDRETGQVGKYVMNDFVHNYYIATNETVRPRLIHVLGGGKPQLDIGASWPAHTHDYNNAYAHSQGICRFCSCGICAFLFGPIQ